MERWVSCHVWKMQKETPAVEGLSKFTRLQKALQRTEELKMQLTQFNAYCPFEVGDRILDTAGQVHTITDIACVHYVRGGNVEFRFELDHSGYYAPITAQDPPAKERAATLAAQISPTEPFPPPTSGPIRRKQPQDPPRNEHDGKRVKILICDESSQLPPEFKEFIKKRFG